MSSSMARSRMVSCPRARSSSVMSTFTSGSTPNSVSWPSGLVMGQDEKRMRQPLGNSLVKGSQQPPPVVSPTIVTLGSDFMMATKLLVALNELRLVRTTTGLR